MMEGKILRLIKKHDSSGLEALMNAYIPYVSAIVWNILRGSMSPEDGEEVVSDVFLAAWNQADDLQSGKVKAWLGTVARNKAKNKLRQIGQTISLEDDILELPDLETPANQLQRNEENALLHKAIDTLPPSDREIFLRYYYYYQTVEEISSAMDLNLSTVKTRLRRGRIKLRDVLVRGGYDYEA